MAAAWSASAGYCGMRAWKFDFSHGARPEMTASREKRQGGQRRIAPCPPSLHEPSLEWWHASLCPPYDSRRRVTNATALSTSSFRDVPQGAGPESILPDRGYGFRARALRAPE